jgi:hypothetical protein
MYMLGHLSRTRLLVAFLVVMFLAAQLHFCADLTAGPTSAHICPVCSTVGSVVTPASPSLAVAPVMSLLQTFAVLSAVFAVLPQAISPRAPPAL